MKRNLNDLFQIEFKALASKYYINLIKVVLILWITLLSLGISQGIMNHLALKMKSPFINWVKMNMSNNALINVTGTRDDIIKELGKPEMREKFGIANEKLTYVATDRNIKATNNPGGKNVSVETRTLNVNEPLFAELLKRNGLNPSDITYSDENPELILSESAVEKIFGKDKPYYIWFNNPSTGETMPLKVAAIFSQLPDFADIALTSRLLNDYKTVDAIRIDPENETKMIWSKANHRDYLCIFFPHKLNENAKQEFEKEIRMIFSPDKIKDIVYKEKQNLGDDVTYFTLKLNSVFETQEQFDQLVQSAEKKAQAFQGIRIFEYDQPIQNNLQNNNYDFISVKFDNIEKIKEFSAYLENKYNYKLNLSLIETFENYKSFEKTLYITSGTLVGLSVISLVIFIIGTILSHIERSKKTIGTIKAFGLSNKNLIGVYMKITLSFVGIGLVSAFTLSALIGPLLTKGITRLMNFNDVYSIEFSLLNPAVIFTSIIILAGSLTSVYITLNRRFGKATPGDLVYEREN